MINKIKKFTKEKKADFFKNNELSLLFPNNVSLEEKIKYDFFKQSFNHFIKVSDKLKLKNYAIMKLKKIPKAHSDIDIITTKENIKILTGELQKEGFIVTDDLGYELTLTKKIKNGKIVLDLHTNIQYNNCDFLDPKKVLERKINSNFENKKIKFVSSEDDFIITAIHSMFQKVSYFRYDYYDKLRWTEFTLNDIYQMYYASSSKGFDWNYVIKTAKKYCWEDALVYIIMIMNNYFPTKINKDAIKKISTKNRLKSKIKADVEKNTVLPFYTSIPLMYKICINKSLKEMRIMKLKGFKTLVRYHKWFFVNLLRYIRNKLKRKFLRDDNR